jgi:hypothetical protein
MGTGVKQFAHLTFCRAMLTGKKNSEKCMWHYGAPLDKRGHTDIGRPIGTKNHLFSVHNNLENLDTNW